MNPLTLVKRIQKINSTEASLGISDDASWHAKYKDSAYIFVGGIPFEITEGDLLAVFAQYGEVVDVNLVRDKATGKSKGFAFLAYEDQRSTVLAVDNLNGAKILGRIVRVDHVTKYKKKEEEEDEEKEKQKREARGVCRAFQRGQCNRGASCKFSHDEQRNANTGWGADDVNARWGHELSEDPISNRKKSADDILGRSQDHKVKGREAKYRPSNEDRLTSRVEHDGASRTGSKRNYGRETKLAEDREGQISENRSSYNKTKPHSDDDQERQRYEKRSRPDRTHPDDDQDRRRSEQRSRYDETRQEDDRGRRGSEKGSRHDRGSAYHHHREDGGRDRSAHR